MQVIISMDEYNQLQGELQQNREIIAEFEEINRHWTKKVYELNKIKYTIVNFFEENDISDWKEIYRENAMLDKLPRLTEKLFDLTKDSFLATCEHCECEDLEINMTYCEGCGRYFCPNCEDMNYGMCEVCNELIR